MCLENISRMLIKKAISKNISRVVLKHVTTVTWLFIVMSQVRQLVDLCVPMK